MRKERKEAVYAAEMRKQAMLEWIVGLGAAIIGAGILVGVIYIVGAANGNW